MNQSINHIVWADNNVVVANTIDEMHMMIGEINKALQK